MQNQWLKDKPKCTIDEYGTKRWYLNGKLHREDGAAVEYSNGSKSWWINDQFIRREKVCRING